MNKAAQALGRLGKGIPKNYNSEEIKRRSEWMKSLNESRASRKIKSKTRETSDENKDLCASG